MPRYSLVAGMALVCAACPAGEPMTPDPGLDACTPGSGGLVLSTAVGQVEVFKDPALLSCIEIPSSSDATDYIFVAANADSTTDRVFNYMVQSDVGSAAPADAPTAALARIEDGASAGLVSLAFESALRDRERRIIDLPAARAAWDDRRAAQRRAPVTLRASIAAAAVVAGDLRTIRVPNFSATDLCNNYFTIGARAKAVGQHAVIWQDTLAPANGFVDQDFAQIASEFDGLIYPTDTRFFGQPSDMDADGKIHLVYTPEVNKLTPRGSSGFIGGFFFGGDLLPRTANNQPVCPQSNESELFYLLVPDPAGAFGDIRSTSTVSQGTRGTVSHEFQHMINAGRRLADPAVMEFEVPWLNEALSHLAEELVGRALKGFGDLQHLTINDISDPNNNYRDFNSFFFQNLARFELWLANPDTSAPTSIRARDQLAPRGAAWALLRYSADHYANDDVADFTHRLVGGPRVSVANFVEHAGAPFDSILVGWMIANYADELAVQSLATRYTYRSWHLRGVQSAINGGFYPLKVRSLGASQSVSTQARSSSGSYFRRSVAEPTPVSVFRFVGADGKLLSASGARLYVLRAR